METTRQTARDMAVMESNALALGVSIDNLMENAGRAVAEEVVRHLPQGSARVAVLAGTGNNGGDGTCAAFYLAQWGYAPEVWIVRAPAEIRSAPARRCYDRIAHRAPVHFGVPTPGELSGFPLALDALLGTGQSGELRPPYSVAVGSLRESGVPVLSVDVPSGLGAANAVRPRWTVTLTCLKVGMEPENSGEVVVRDIGIPRAAMTEAGPGEFHLFPLPPPTGRVGRVVVVGGGPYAGAPALTALAALRAGAERATVICPVSVAAQVQSFSPALVVFGVGSDRLKPESLPAVQRFLAENRHDALALGMGAGRAPSTVAALTELLRSLPPSTPVLVDADGLEAALAARPGAEPARPWVLTPNSGELLRLTRLPGPATTEERRSAAERLARENGLTVLAKGDPDEIADLDRSYVNRHHHPSGTVAGVGDLLSGVVAALLAQGLDPLSAARLGAYWVGDAGLRVFERKSYGLIATDILEELPSSLAEGLARIRS
jgi:NAD(P)H-hydrate epimerase